MIIIEKFGRGDTTGFEIIPKPDYNVPAYVGDVLRSKLIITHIDETSLTGVNFTVQAKDHLKVDEMSSLASSGVRHAIEDRTAIHIEIIQLCPLDGDVTKEFGNSVCHS